MGGLSHTSAHPSVPLLAHPASRLLPSLQVSFDFCGLYVPTANPSQCLPVKLLKGEDVMGLCWAKLTGHSKRHKPTLCWAAPGSQAIVVQLDVAMRWGHLAGVPQKSQGVWLVLGA